MFRNKPNYRVYHIPGYCFPYGYCYCFLELHFKHISRSKRIKNLYIDTELVLPMYNAHPYFSLKNLGQRACQIWAKYGTCLSPVDPALKCLWEQEPCLFCSTPGSLGPTILPGPRACDCLGGTEGRKSGHLSLIDAEASRAVQPHTFWWCQSLQ